MWLRLGARPRLAVADDAAPLAEERRRAARKGGGVGGGVEAAEGVAHAFEVEDAHVAQRAERRRRLRRARSPRQDRPPSRRAEAALARAAAAVGGAVVDARQQREARVGGGGVRERRRVSDAEVGAEERGDGERVGRQALVEARVQPLQVERLAVLVVRRLEEGPHHEGARAQHPRQHERAVERHRERERRLEVLELHLQQSQVALELRAHLSAEGERAQLGRRPRRVREQRAVDERRRLREAPQSHVAEGVRLDRRLRDDGRAEAERLDGAVAHRALGPRGVVVVLLEDDARALDLRRMGGVRPRAVQVGLADDVYRVDAPKLVNREEAEGGAPLGAAHGARSAA